MMVWRAFGIALLISILMVTPVKAAGPESFSVSDVSDQLVCQCGCNMILTNCSHIECGSREAMTTFIVQEMDRAQTTPQIIQTFVIQYGEQVLASPPKRGFNLVAWILPFVVILAGGVVIVGALRKWVSRGMAYQTDGEVEAEEGDEKYRLQLEKDLKEFAGGGFR
ncbi:MAG: cytochrome c-type biogenesis protein CcmH [Dehalococcoidales bacterium]